MGEDRGGVVSCFPPLHPHGLHRGAAYANGLLAYSFKSEVIILKGDLMWGPPLSRNRPSIRISSLDWNSSADSLVIGYEDGQVVVFRLEGRVLSGRHEYHVPPDRKSERASHPIRVCVSWSKAPEGDFIYTADEYGVLVSWDLGLNTARTFKFGRHNITALESHPSEPNIVAFGCKSGIINVVDLKTGTGKVIRNFNRHIHEIQSLAWSPLRAPFSGEGDHTHYLASLCSYKAAYIWSCDSGRFHLGFKIDRKKQKKHSHFIQSNCLSWPSSSTIITTSSGNEILKWKLDAENQSTTPEFSVLHTIHSADSMVLVMCAGKTTSNTTTVITIGTDRCLASYELETENINFSLPTLSFGVFDIAFNMVEVSTMAIVAADSFFRVWNTDAHLDKGQYDFKCIYGKLKNIKIASVAWHPNVEGKLAAGTQNGYVGVIDVISKTPAFEIFDYQHEGFVYKLTWAPRLDGSNHSSELFLYSVGNGNVVLHESKKSSIVLNDDKNSPLFIDKIGDTSEYSNISMKTHESSRIIFSLGYSDGTVVVRSCSNILVTLKFHQKIVHSTAWHPIHYDNGISKYSDWIAVSTNEKVISVWDLGSILSNRDDHSESIILTLPNVILKGHNAKIVQVEWSPHDEEKLLSVSYDLSAQIWNAVTGEPLANFRCHFKRLLCGAWSNTDPDVVYTGGDDSVLYAWRISEQKEKIPPPFKKTTKLKNVGTVVSIQDDDRKGREEHDVTTPKVVEDEKHQKMPHTKSFFPLAHIAESNASISEDCLALDKAYSLEPDVETITSLVKEKPHLKHFISSSIVDQNINCDEVSFLKSLNLYNNASNVQFWSSGDIGLLLREATSEGRLNDWLVSISASVSHKTWKETCSAYAEQLIKLNLDYVKSSTYYLMSQNPLRAVEVLTEGKIYKGAISIIKGRLNSNPDLLNDVYVAWAKNTGADGRHELSAKCWLAAGGRIVAADTLAKIRDNPDCMKTAGLLYFRHGDNKKSQEIVAHAASLYLKNERWSSLENMIEWAKDFPSVRGYYKPLSLAKIETDRVFIGNKVLSEIENTSLILKLRDCVCKNISLSEDDYEKAYLYLKDHSLCLPKINLLEELLLCSLSLYSKKRSLLHLVNCFKKCLTDNDDPTHAYKLFYAILGGKNDPPNIGLSLWREELDWQCGWGELNSVQSYISLVKLQYFLANNESDCSDSALEEISSSLMMEDVICSQRMLLDIKEAEESMIYFDEDVNDYGDNHNKNVRKEDLPNMESLSLKDQEYPILKEGQVTQTMELNSDGEWKTVLATSIPPPTDTSMPSMPPPMDLRKSFKERFLRNRLESTKVAAQKEIQKLKWEQSRTNVLVTPFPDLTEAIKDILHLVDKIKANKGDPDRKYGIMIKDIAAWAFWNGATKDQKFFLDRT